MLAVDALYDPEAADIHEAAIAAELERDQRADDTRPQSQRKADAVTNIMRASLQHADTGTARAFRRHVTYVVDAHDFPEATPDLVAELRGEVRRHGRLSAATLERLSCDCDISRVITAGRSEILDVGRTTRTISTALWKALVVRDRHCRAPGCDQPPERCEGHHLTHWAAGGPTRLENLQLLCWHHHRQQHSHDAHARAA